MYHLCILWNYVKMRSQKKSYLSGLIVVNFLVVKTKKIKYCSFMCWLFILE